ncbi:MAG: ribonucleoside-diphosphate reductase, adenosylcobalamin-dependent, partial [Methanocalculus sp. MSAO_Arc1]
MSATMRDHILKSRYLLPGEETFSDLCRRVADAVGRDETEREVFFRMLERCRFLPNSPALMNAGTASSQLAACFVLPVGSTVPEIFESMKQGAVIQVSGG